MCSSSRGGKSDTMRGLKGFVGKIGRMQRMGALQITRVLRTILNNLLDAHAGLEPINIRIR